MKTIKSLLIMCLFGAMTLTSCKYNAGDRIPGTTSAKVDSVSYALGVWFGGTIKSADFGELNYCKMEKGLKDMLNEKELDITENEIMQLIQNYLMQRQTYKSEKSLTDNTAFMEKNKEKEGVVTTESGLQYQIITEGTGIAPTSLEDTVEVNYKGSLIDGTVFDSSYERQEALKIPLKAVVKGWGEGLMLMKEGGKSTLFIPASLGYGPNPNGPIPANSTLVFEVELIKVFPSVQEEPKEATPIKKK